MASAAQAGRAEEGPNDAAFVTVKGEIMHVAKGLVPNMRVCARAVGGAH